MFFLRRKRPTGAEPDKPPAADGSVSGTDPHKAEQQIDLLIQRMRAVSAARTTVARTYDALQQSLKDLKTAKEQDVEIKLPNPEEVDGEPFRQYLTRFQDIFVRIEVSTKGRKDGLAKMEVELAILRRTTNELDALVITSNLDGFNLRVRACHFAAGRLVAAARTSIRDYTTFFDDESKSYFPEDRRKDGEPRKKIEPIVKKVADAAEKVIVIHSRTMHALATAKRTVEVVDQLEKKKIVEPQKPTSEEVGRYLKQLEQWCREHLPAQREAGKDVRSFRELHATLERDVSVASRRLARIIYIAKHRVDPDLVGALKAMDKLFERMAGVARLWRFTSNSWATRKFDRSEPLLEVTPAELESIEHLEAQVRNVGIAASGKVMARIKYDSLKNSRKEALPSCPKLTSIPSDDAGFDEALGLMQKHITALQEVERRNEKARAEIEVAWDAFETSRQRAKEAAASCKKVATNLERLLTRAPSDEMRIHLHRVAKLYDIHTESDGFYSILDSSDQALTLLQGDEDKGWGWRRRDQGDNINDVTPHRDYDRY